MRIVGPIPQHIERLMPGARKITPVTHEEPSKADAQSEKELQKLCANYLRQLNVPFHVSKFGKKSSSTVGWPDFTFPYRGRFYAVEFKVGSNHPSPEQSRCLQAIEANGGVAVVVRSFDEFRNLLK